MKKNTLKYSFFLIFFLFLIACSTKNNTFVNRNSHALSTKYNILYNGGLGLEKGLQAIKANDQDNFWKMLPIEKMQFDENFSEGEKTKNPDFEKAETKATKAIQKHSMNIGGRERNYQIDEAYLMLGKARYYDQRFIPALEAFNYILYKYPNSSNIYTAKIWREKTNMRLGNDAIVVKNINQLLKKTDLNKQTFSDANALLAEAFLNLEERDSAVAKLRIAEQFSRINEDRARYKFILGQMYQEVGNKDSATYYYDGVIHMNRKADRKYMMHAYAKKAQMYDYEKGNDTIFLKTYNKLVADRENRPYYDVLFYEMGVFYDKKKDKENALKFYNKSLGRKSKDPYLMASAYRNIGNMYFKNTDYTMAAKYYDSTLTKLNPKTREFAFIEKNRKNLDNVIKYEGIAKRNDSIIKVYGMPDSERKIYFESYIAELKKKDEAKRILEEKEKEKLANVERNNSASSAPTAVNPNSLGKPANMDTDGIRPPSGNDAVSTFYFYNPTTVAYGKLQFKKMWGNRTIGGNWRLSAIKAANDAAMLNDSINEAEANKLKDTVVIEKYTTAFYEKQLPKTQIAIDSIGKERNFAYYQLGLIYKEKFKEYTLASDKLEQLLRNNPEEKLILPSMYNLYKIYQITDPAKAEKIKSDITNNYPGSRYAQILNNTNTDDIPSPEKEYQKWYKLFQEEKFDVVLDNIDNLINQYSGDEIVSKFELLKANTLGKVNGLEAYKKGLENVADNYPNSDEGKNAREILEKQVPTLERLNFTTEDNKNWKILYLISNNDTKTLKQIEEAIRVFLLVENFERLTTSFDKYNRTQSFVAIHGLKSEAYAQDVAGVFRDDKKYKIAQPAIIISTENYKVVQIKKNLEAYLTPKNP
ncbi:tetratricopeptide repeat protein [Flavobacterium johnsoniae]|uniref:SprE n=1 Tax=Flavobacterium johnsoniae (strain ATCC 17061 / DSM 2064 / JCM 8514 / BCRC 14874 / CCUG 350202 / NBRC 14942 / NCIMB 11054 / UW101) TaxID=376686 RepID=A1E5T9_FLAJ1|nr:SprE [Flavobacterium johnsoniae UW101]ABQ04084.2 SprE [Flavobacterium johnsoniae UW101]OXG02681.1 gliding motility protein [Flavobacterium johnsoniae UW101]8GL8_I Chain I, SprE [Flavobacterium johnsoniae]SHK11898.1 protein involved in gliding motility SprE [Flavobacterium johnsoniae]